MLKYLLSALVAFVLALILGPILIPLLRKMKFGQTEREEGPASHKVKQGTPTIGGIIFLFPIVISSLAFGIPNVEFLLPALLAMLSFGLIGFLDDFIKVSMKRNLGLRAYQKFGAQFIMALAFAIWAYNSPNIGPILYLPISGNEWDMGIWYIPFVVFMILAETNAVNLIDGLDGLSTSVTSVYTFAMIIVFSLLSTQADKLGDFEYSASLNGMAVFGSATFGALIGFLWFNAYPAKVFMGDTGSLALGGVVSILAICSRSALLLPIMGICYVATALSVVLQVSYFKLTKGKRIFKMAPLHHHFELCGMHETKVVSMYTIITMAACGLCLISYFVSR